MFSKFSKPVIAVALLSFLQIANANESTLIGTYKGNAYKYVPFGEVQLNEPCVLSVEEHQGISGQDIFSFEIGSGKESARFEATKKTLEKGLADAVGGNLILEKNHSSLINPFKENTEKLEATVTDQGIEELSIQFKEAEIYVTNQTGLRCEKLIRGD